MNDVHYSRSYRNKNKELTMYITVRIDAGLCIVVVTLPLLRLLHSFFLCLFTLFIFYK